MSDPEQIQGGIYYPIPDLDRYDRVRSMLERRMDQFHLHIENKEYLQMLSARGQDEGVLLSPTHTSWLDIIALGAANDIHRMRFLGKDQLWRVPYIGGLAVDAGAYSVNRSNTDSKKAAINTTIAMLDHGEWAVMYPEGTRNRSKDHRSLGLIKTGAVRVAMQAQGLTPVVPIGIGYNRGILCRKASPFHIGLVIGKPLYIKQQEPEEQAVREYSSELKNMLSELKIKAVGLAEKRGSSNR